MVRLALALIMITLGASGMYVVPVVIPAVQAEFGATRADVSLTYTALMIAFGIGGIYMGRMADRYGVARPLTIGGAALGIGYLLAAMSSNIWVFALVHGLIIGLIGSASAFSPLLADISLWFVRRRGIAVAICASGNYLSGVIWPPILQALISDVGWRQTYVYVGIFTGVAMMLVAQFMRRRPPLQPAAVVLPSGELVSHARPFNMSATRAQLLLSAAGLGCCVAMAMPQVHIVAYCGDLGYGPARGAEMLSLMLATGIISRLVSGWICDRIGGLRTLLFGSVLQGIALLLFLPFDSLVSLYVISALFGLFQGGLVPSYAIIVREHFPAAEAGRRVGVVLTFTMFGMALGGWMSGVIFDLTGGYHWAFINGFAFNLMTLTIALVLLLRVRGKRSGAPPAGAVA